MSLKNTDAREGEGETLPLKNTHGGQGEREEKINIFIYEGQR